MKFEFSEEQELLRNEARRFLQGECGSSVVRQVLESDAPFHKPLWDGIAGLGWTGVAIPAEHGGLGMGYLELCVIAEEIGRALAPVPFASSIYLAAEALLRAGGGMAPAPWLARLARGEAIGCLAVAEGAGSRAWARPAVAARRAADGSYRLDGVKWPVLDGIAADIAVVSADGPDGMALHLVELDQVGVARSPEPSIDESRPQARLILRDAVAHRLPRPGDELLREVADRAAVLFAFEQLGGAEACLQMAVAYAKERYAFGRRIGSFQAIKHRLADVYAELELARSNCFYAAWALSTGDASLREAAAVARLSMCNAFFLCAKECIQVHGGIGFTWQLDAHLYYRRSQLLGAVLGSAPRWRGLLLEELERHRSAGQRPDRGIAGAV